MPQSYNCPFGFLLLMFPLGSRYSAASFNFSGAGNTNMFKNNLRIRLSPLKSSILRKYTNPFKEVVCILVFLSAMLRGAGAVLIYALRIPFLHLNGRRFSVVNMSDLT